MIKKYNKRASHVSFIISFVLFVSFLIFFIGLLNPFEKVETGKNFLLKHLENEIIKKVSGEVLVISALEDTNSDCSEINNLNIKNYKIHHDGNLVNIYSSDDFQANIFQCTAQQGYKVGLVRNEKYLLQSKISDLNNSYENNYEALKADFEIPEINDFEFSFLDINENPIIKTSSRETPATGVFAELVQISYLDENDIKIKKGYIKVVIW